MSKKSIILVKNFAKYCGARSLVAVLIKARFDPCPHPNECSPHTYES
jgi:hypothetical protein